MITKNLLQLTSCTDPLIWYSHKQLNPLHHITSLMLFVILDLFALIEQHDSRELFKPQTFNQLGILLGVDFSEGD